ncbi:hypothetical protein HA402_015563 [Bradysia odoriphaga]|nr:hypothetical protein HA402_015563 [Bradysia odoriphaga]
MSKKRSEANGTAGLDFLSQGMLGTTGGRFLGPSGSHPHRNLWPLHSGRGLDFQANGEVTESIFAAGYNTPPTNSPFMSLSPLELVSKNFHSGTVAFSQANSIFVQSQTDFLGGTVATKKTETSFGRWEHGIEPLQIQVPPLTSIASVPIKSDRKTSTSALCGKTDGFHHNTNCNSSTNLSNHSRHTDVLTNKIRTNDISSGCSRTIPISWTSAASSSTNNIVDSRNIGCSLLQIKREPCQVSEITTSNNLGPTPLTAVIKLESHSPKRTMDNMQNAAQSGIPVGIAVARQRLQEHAQQQHQPKEINRFGIGIATDLEAVTMGVSNVQNAVRTPPTLWQYPRFQLVRDPSSGQFMFLPTATSLDKLYISYPEPFQQAVVWPSYQQQMQTPHLLMPPMAPLSQQMQPPPLAPIQLLGSDYLGGATLHQHTQTHSTRLVALTSDNKRKSAMPNQLPMPATLIKIEDCSSATNGNTTTSAHHQQSHMFDPCKSTSIQTIATSVQTGMTPELEAHHQMYYQSEGSLIQMASHNNPCGSMIEDIEARSLSPLSYRRDMSPASDHLENSTPSVPEVQDAHIQTDTPVMSEDDNTTGEDDCTFPSSASPTNDSSAITTSVSFNDMCHNVSSLSEANTSHPLYQQDLNSTKSTETSFDSNTTVTSSIVIEEISIRQPDPIVLSSYESSESIDTDHQPIHNFPQKLHAPDLSGLELLSNSIEAFEKKTFIKQEPIEKADMVYNIDTSLTQTEPIDCSMQPKEYIPSNVTEPLGGLNLLCALAEQRFQEEVGQRSRKRSTSTDGSESKRHKKHHKDKQSSKKKKSKHDKERRGSRSKHQQSDEDEDFVEKNLSETFNRVKASYQRQCSCKKATATGEVDSCCHEKCNFPTPEEVYSAMHTDMKQKLNAIAKEFQEEKRKLNEIKNLDKVNHSRESTPSSSSKSFSFDSEQSTKTELISPNISSSSQSETFAADSSKMHSDTESMRFDEADTSSACKQRKLDAINVVDSSSLATMKAKSLVGYIFASKKRLNDSKTDNSSSMTDETSQSDINSIKQEVPDDEELSQEALFGRTKRDFKLKHQSKHKKSKSKDRKHRRSSESKSKKKKIDARCTLTGEHLDSLSSTSKQRVLTAMGGLFYAGSLSPVQPPDVYSVTLDGERGNRPHIMSREEILRDAILEVAPQSVSEVPPGSRLCAYWSQQYRCLYPGTSAHPSSSDYEFDPKFIAVEFDDGDSGRIAIEDIRYLLSDYPIVDYDPNPLLTLGKRKQRSSHSETYATSEGTNEPTTSTNCFSIFKDKVKAEDKEAHKERRRLKKIRKDKNKEENSVDKKHKHKHKCNDEFCKHRKHKKRRKHKKHSHRDAESAVEVKSEEKDDEILSQEDNVSQTDDSNEQNDEVFKPEIKEETMTEEEATSSVTDSSGSNYQPTKKKERQNSAENHSKIAAFLPARQLWAWSGKGIKRSGAKGRGKKQFYRTIQRGKETISVGDSAVFLSTGRPDRPYIGRIECMWETSTNNRIVRVKWYYHPEETTGCPKLIYPGGLFQSPHEDENDVQTISHKCKVLPFDQYTEKYGPDPKQYESVYDNNDTFYLAGHYDPTSIVLTLENHIPSTTAVKASDKKK